MPESESPEAFLPVYDVSNAVAVVVKADQQRSRIRRLRRAGCAKTVDVLSARELDSNTTPLRP